MNWKSIHTWLARLWLANLALWCVGFVVPVVASIFTVYYLIGVSLATAWSGEMAATHAVDAEEAANTPNLPEGEGDAE